MFVRRTRVRRVQLFIILIGITFTILFTLLISEKSNPKFQSLREFPDDPDIDLDAIITDLRSKKTFLIDASFNVQPNNSNVFRFVLGDLEICRKHKVLLLILVKTEHGSLAQRAAIRRTWGNASCYYPYRTQVLFLLGATSNPKLEKKITFEQEIYGDILQQNFVDNYYNNTYKLMMGFEFFSKYCSDAEFLVMIDHDYLLNPFNLLHYILNVHPRLYSRFLAGYVWYAPTPKRDEDNKWRQTRDEYPFDLFPNYAEAGTLIVSSEFAKDLYIAMLFTKFHKFDDVFLGIILHRLHIAPIHVNQVLHLRPTTIPPRFISIHGFETPVKLMVGWTKSELADQCG